MVDIITVAVLGFYPESLSNWTSNVQNPLTIAVHDFPKKGTLVCPARIGPLIFVSHMRILRAA